MSLGYAVLVLTIYILAVASFVRLINHDTILDPVRIWMSGRAQAAYVAATEAESKQQPVIAAGHEKRMARWNLALHFAGCPWCVAMWTGFATAYLPVHLIGWPAWTLIPVALATRYLVGVAAPLSADATTSLQSG